ncbi:MAG: response regulator [Nitrospirae bacterium]|nr:response regulator [Nitrospirota bacterium]
MMNKILIIDDEQPLLYGMSKALKKLCAFEGEVTTAANGAVALKEISEGSYDICFLDLNLPDSDGIEILRRIKEKAPETTVVIMTGDHISNDLKREIEKGGASLIMEKPVDLLEVKAFIRYALDKEGSRNGQIFFRKGLSEDKRKFERIPINRDVFYYLSEDPTENSRFHAPLKAVIIDISRGGMGIRTNYSLKEDQLLSFHNGFENMSGIVKWTKSVDTGCRAGIMLV